MYYLIDTKRLYTIWHVRYSKVLLFLKTLLEFQLCNVLIFNTHPADTHLELLELKEKKKVKGMTVRTQNFFLETVLVIFKSIPHAKATSNTMHIPNK